MRFAARRGRSPFIRLPCTRQGTDRLRREDLPHSAFLINVEFRGCPAANVEGERYQNVKLILVHIELDGVQHKGFDDCQFAEKYASDSAVVIFMPALTTGGLRLKYGPHLWSDCHVCGQYISFTRSNSLPPAD